MPSQAGVSNQKVSTKHSSRKKRKRKPGKTKYKARKRQKLDLMADSDSRKSWSGKRKRLGEDNSDATRERLRLRIKIPARTPTSESSRKNIATPSSCLVATPQLTPGGLLQYEFTSPDQSRYPWSIQAALLPLKTTTSTRVLRSDTPMKKFLGNMIGIHDKINHKIPRYLFRMWHPLSAGGDLIRHTTASITPHGFRDRNKGHASIWDMEYDVFKSMIHAHTIKGRQRNSEFTSWSQSLNFVLTYAGRTAETAFIAILDTEKIRATNAVFWVPRLVGKFPEEFLVHGPIRDWRTKRQRMRDPFGLPYTAVPFRSLVSRGLLTCYPFYKSKSNDTYLSNPGAFRDEKVRRITLDEVRALRHVAAAFRKPFSIIFTIALITLIPRAITPSDLDTILHGLGKSTFKHLNYSQSASILQDYHLESLWEDQGYKRVLRDAGKFMDVKQMIDLMRGLFWRVWGRGDNCGGLEGRAGEGWEGLEGLEGLTPTTPGHW